MNHLQIIRHPCRQAHGIALIKPFLIGNPAFITENSWTSHSMYSLSTALCNSSCPNGFTVYDIHFSLYDKLLFITSNGLYRSTTSFRNVKRIVTGHIEIDSPSTSLQFSNRGCFGDMIILQGPSTIYWSFVNNSNKWNVSASLPDGHTLVSSFNWENDLPDISPRIVTVMSSNQFAIVNATSGTILDSSFPLDITWTIGMTISIQPHVDGHGLLMVMGSMVLRSEDAGYTWHELFYIPNDDTIIDIATTHSRNAVAALSVHGNIFVSRTGTTGAFPVPSSVRFNGTNPPPLNLIHDLDGSMYLLLVSSLDGITVTLTRIPVGTVESGQRLPELDAPNPVIRWPQGVAIGVRPSGVNTWELLAVNYLTGITSPGTWRSIDEGMVVLHAGDPNSSMLVTRVSLDGSSANVQLMRTIPTMNMGSVSGSTLDMIQGPTVDQVNLVLTTSGKYWVTSIFGCTIIINGVHSVYITSVIDSSRVLGKIISNKSLSLPVTNISNWKIFDFRSQVSVGMPTGQTISIFGPTTIAAGDTVSLTTNTGVGYIQFDRSIINTYLTFKSGSAILRIVTCPTQTTATAIVVVPMTGLTSTTFSADNVMIFFGDFFIAGILSRHRNWSLYPPSCPVRRLDMTYAINNSPLTRSFLPTVYISSLEVFSMQMTTHWVPETPVIEQRGPSMSSQSNYMAHHDLHSISWNVQTDTDRVYPYSISNITINNFDEAVTPLIQISHSKSVRSIVSMCPSALSVICPITIPTVRIISGCNPCYRLRIVIPGTTQYSLTDDLLFSNGESRIQTLPTNYRPPSALGIAVPNSTYIYNADPSLPRYNDFFAISQTTGTYQQCKDATNRSACGCSQEQTLSLSVDDSDCIEKVFRQYQQSTMPLKLEVSYDMVSTYFPVTTEFTIKELNGRSDWCITSLSGACTNPVNQIATANPSQNSAVTFHGAELYHFRAIVPIGAYCQLTTDFPVYVINSTPLPSVHQSTMAITAIMFCFWLLSIYLWYAYKG